MIVQPYLMFDGRCEEAIEFYRKAAGAQPEMLMRYKESPEPQPPGSRAGFGEKVMHASFRIGDSQIMASDDCMSPQSFSGFALSLTVASPAEVQQKFDALAAGGKVTLAPTQTFWSPSFGMLVDKFGVHWMVMAEPK